MLVVDKSKKFKFYSLIGTFILVTASIVSIILPEHVGAASYTWDGGGTDGTCGGNAGDGNKWSCAANWSSDIVPVAGDTVTFNGTSTKNANIDSGFAGTITNFTISSGYTGTITLQRSLTVNGPFAQSDGTLTAANQTLDFNSTFTLNTGSIFTASSGTTNFGGAFTINGGTFNHNNGTATFDNSGTHSLSCNNVIFNLVTFAGTPIITIGSNCTLPLGTNPSTGVLRGTLNGTLSGTGTITFANDFTFGTTAVFSGFTAMSLGGGGHFRISGGDFGTITSLTGTNGDLTINGTFNASSFTTFDMNFSFIIGATGIFTAPTGTMNIAQGFTVNSGGVFNHNNGTVHLDGSAVLSCNNITFNLVTISAGGNNVTVGSDCNLPLGNNPTITAVGVIVNGTLSGTGTYTANGGLTLNSGSQLSGFTGLVLGGALTSSTTFNAGSYTTFDLNGFILNSGAVFTAPSLMTVDGNFTINAGSTFNHNNGTLTFDGIQSSTISCNNATFNLVNLTGTTNPKTVSSNCTFPLGNNPTVGRYLISGALTGTGSLTFNGISSFESTAVASGFTTLFTSPSFTHNGGNLGGINSYTASGAVIIGGAWNAGNYTLFDVNASFTMNSGAVFTAPSSTATFHNAFTINAGATFNHNNGTIRFISTANVTLSCNNQVFNLVVFAHAGGTKTVSSNCNFPLGNNPNLGSNVGNVTLSGTLSGTGTLTTFGTLTTQSGSTVTGFTSLISNTLTRNGGSYIGLTSVVSNIALNVNDAWNVATYTTFDANGTFTTGAAANFTAPSSMTVAGAFTLNASSTFNHNSGTIIFDGTTSATLSCGSKTLNFVILAHTTGTKTISSNCTLPLGGNPTSTGPLTLNGTLLGSGSLTVDGAFTMNTGSVLNCFSSISANPFVYNGGNLCGISTPHIWDGGGTDGTCGGAAGDGNKWSCALNWSTDTVPGALDTVQFDGTSTKNSVIDGGFSGNVLSITINSGYTGTITQQRSLNLQGFYTQSSGIFTGSAHTITMNGNFNLTSPGVFNAPTDTMTVTGTFNINSGTFNASSGNIFIGGIYNHTGGTFNGSSGNITVTSAFFQSTGSTFTSSSGIFSIGAAMTIASGAIFNHNNGTVNFNPITLNSILACNGAVFNLVTFKYSGDGTTAFNRTINSNCNFPLGNDPVIEAPIIVNVSTLSGTGTFKTGYTLTLNSGSQFIGFTGFDSVIGPTSNSIGSAFLLGASGVLNASNYTTFVVGSTFTMAASTTFTAPASMSVGRGFLISQTTSNFIHNNGTIYFTDPQVSTNANIQLLCTTNTVLNKVVFTHTTSTKIIDSSSASDICTFPLGNNPTIPGSLRIGFGGVTTLRGNLSGTGTLTINGDVTHHYDGIITGFDEVIFNGTYSVTTANPIFTNVDKITFNEVATFANTFNGNQISEIIANDNVIIDASAFTAPASMKVAGDFINNGGTFIHNSGTVEFIGSDIKTITGDTAFNNLTVNNSLAPTLSFTSGSTQTVLGLLTLKGQPGNLVTLKSTTPGSPWDIDVQGTYDIEYVNVSDSTALTTTLVVGCDSFDAGGNTNWEFGTTCSPTVFNLGPTENVSGSSINESQPTFTFSVSDPDPWDTIRYTIEIDNNSDFSSPEVCYTSAFVAPGSFSFTVGQAPGSGTYTCGEEGQELADGNYYWRVIATDSIGYSSGYKLANSGNVAFFVLADDDQTEISDSPSCTTVKSLCPKTIILIPEVPTNTGTDNPTDELPETGNSNSQKSSSSFMTIPLLLVLLPFSLVLFIMLFSIIKDKKKNILNN